MLRWLGLFATPPDTKKSTPQAANQTETKRCFQDRLSDLGITNDNSEFPSVFTDPITFYIMDTPVILDKQLAQVLDETTVKQCIRETGSFKNPFTNIISGKANYTEYTSLKIRIESYVVLLEKINDLIDQVYAYSCPIDDMSALFENAPQLLQLGIQEQKKSRIQLIQGLKCQLIDHLMQLSNVITTSVDMEYNREEPEKEIEKKALLKGINLFIHLLCVECAQVNALPDNLLDEQFTAATQAFPDYKPLAFNIVKPWLEASVVARLIRLSGKMENSNDTPTPKGEFLPIQPHPALLLTPWMSLYQPVIRQDKAQNEIDEPELPVAGID